VRILLANLYFKKYLWSLYNADTGPSPCLLHLCYQDFVAVLHGDGGGPSGGRWNAPAELGSACLKTASGCLLLRRVRGAVGRRCGDRRAGGRPRPVCHRRS
jgi:hypothetical protein